jgi:hypothetical protein
MNAISTVWNFTVKVPGYSYRIYLAQIGVECGRNLRLTGIPLIYSKTRGSIKIGHNVRMASSEFGNVLGLNHRGIVRTIDRKARIEIGNGVNERLKHCCPRAHRD